MTLPGEVTNMRITVVVPIYQEEKNIVPLYERLEKVTNAIKDTQWEYIFVNDGSKDRSLVELKRLAAQDQKVRVIDLSRNFGKEIALTAGVNAVNSDAVICMDADLQHPPDVIPELISKWEEGFEIVNTIRNDHQSISFAKKTSSRIFYQIMRKISDVNIENGMADFRLIDKKVLKQLKLFSENYLFFRGIIPWMGFKQTVVPFIANERFAGTTKYTFRKMLRFATTGVTAFSVKPLKLSIYLGSAIALLSFIYGLYAAYIHLFTDRAITGWTSVIFSVLFIGGINLLMLGIIGEYLGKLFIENKRRPNYLISETNLDE